MNRMSEAECINMQNSLKNYIQEYNVRDMNSVKTIAGVDIAYWKEDSTERAVCCIVVIDINTHKVLERKQTLGEVNFPYIPGCLAFREIPLILQTVDKLKTDVDVYMLDGNGLIHPRNMGLATQISFYLGKPTIGVAKTYYKVNNVDFDIPENYMGATTDIVINNKVAGRALRTHKDVKPVFVSVGNYIDLSTAIDITLKVVGKESHIPVPTRLADLDTHLYRSQYKVSSS